MSPVELYRSAAGFNLNDDVSGERNEQNLEAGGKEPYPNLGTVPPPPDRAMSSIDRQKLQQGLAEDRTQAKQRDADLRRSGTASAAPTPITRPSSSADAAAPLDKKRGADGSLPRGGVNTSGAHRSAKGTEQPPQETALNSPVVRAVPEGDTPRAAPPPPSLPPPGKPRRPAAEQVGKPAPNATAKGPAPASPAAAASPPHPTPDAGSVDSAKASSATVDPTRIPPPPPATMMMPPHQAAAAATPPPADAASTAKQDGAPPVPPLAATAPGASWPPPLGPSETPKSPSEQTAAPDPPRAPQQPPPSPSSAPAAGKPPEQQAALTPDPQGPGKRGTVSLQAAEINFVNNGLTLTAEDDRRLADVVKLYDKHGGLIRVVGYGRRAYGADAAQQELASFSKAIERANVVAKALTQLGLASNRIVVQAAPVGDGLGEDRAEVLLEF